MRGESCGLRQLGRFTGLAPVIYVAVAIGIAAVALAATFLPARRAATVDPLRALRLE